MTLAESMFRNIQSIAFALCVGAFLVVNSTSLLAQDGTGPSYTVDLTDALNHYITVTMIAETTFDETEVMMATWTPGSYLVREYAKHIDRIEASTARGRAKPLAMEKISKNRWRIDTSKSKRFKVTYRLYCNERSVRTNWVGQSFGILNGAPTFITLPDQLDRPHSVTLNLPENWKRSATSLLPDGDEAHQYIASNYDELVDSPIVAGNVSLYPFKVDGVEHTLVNVNEAGYWDGQKAAKDLAKVVEAHHKVWGTVPYDRYFFLNIIGGGGGGLEHDNSCLIMTSRWAFRSQGSYVQWLSLASHEFFHTWNIRRVRPKSLVNYDYENEVYTPSLWVAEGVTSYYEDLLLVRCGSMSKDQFLATMGSSISRVMRNKGRKVQSLRDSSHDAWIKFYRPEANSSDTTVSYYTKGSVVSFLLDAEIRSRSGGKKSLDDAMRKLYVDHANGVGYLPSDFRKICSEMAGSDLSEWFAIAVDSTDELDFQTACNWFGFQIGDLKPLADGEKAKAPREPKASRRRWIGIGDSDSPASKAGLSDNDEIIAVNGMRLSGGIQTRIQQFEVGDAVTLLISREDEIMEIAVTIGSQITPPTWGLAAARDATKEHELNLARWLGEKPELSEKQKPTEKEALEEEKPKDTEESKEKVQPKVKPEPKEAEAEAEKEKAAESKSEEKADQKADQKAEKKIDEDADEGDKADKQAQEDKSKKKEDSKKKSDF